MFPKVMSNKEIMRVLNPLGLLVFRDNKHGTYPLFGLGQIFRRENHQLTKRFILTQNNVFAVR
jgi:hypothetical protein